MLASRWSSKLTERRKSLSHTTTPTGNHWHRDTRPKSTSFMGSRIYQQACGSEHEIKYLGARTSEESVGEVTYANKNNNFPNESVYVNIAPRPDNIAIKYPRFAEYNDSYTPEAFLAMQKLRKLKELQVKRDISEKYYSQEIKKLIGDYYFEAKALASSMGPRGKLQSSSFQPYTANRLKNSLEPCGTMTTITRLNCGCVQETTRPIFTTSRGRVQRRNCSQSQNEVFLKSTPSSPQEHLFATIDSRDDRQRVNPTKRPDVESRAYAKIPEGGDRTCETETENEIRNEPNEQKMTERVSKCAPAYCKFSDTSVGSA
ncbi:uncharacterized protein LOC143221902 [Lasioglossum baleicum]|uniref:uncharacterized protein LOC143221902 n=1 Tax=Lasioglossum baleicum TaxID=434251 RepID=UPI003FCDDEB5